VSSVVVDTNIISFELKHDTRTALYAAHLDGQAIALSFATVGELYLWADLHKWGRRLRARLEGEIAKYVILVPDDDTCRIWASVTTECIRQGRPISHNDAWIAACALRFDAPLITHNRKDFEAVPDLQIISEND
jgi:tRNA(fMet)-specific endonuclease VapC